MEGEERMCPILGKHGGRGRRVWDKQRVRVGLCGSINPPAVTHVVELANETSFCLTETPDLICMPLPLGIRTSNSSTLTSAFTYLYTI